MKTKLVLLFAGLFGGMMNLAAQDLAPGINYGYNPPGSDGIITSISVDVVNNDNTSAGSFDVSMYLYDPNTQNVWTIGTTNIPSLSGNALITISNWNIDINNTAGIPAGTYRLGVWVDSNSDITESDENNNAGLLSGNINYTPSASGIADHALNAESVKCMPNPASAFTNLAFTLTENANVSIEIYDMTGRLVKTVMDKESMPSGDNKVRIETETLPAGIYFWTLKSGEVSLTGRLSVSH